jgi:hypothetical protein
MAREPHVDLLDARAGCRGTMVLSGYPNALQDRWLVDWYSAELDLRNRSRMALDCWPA